MSRPSSTLSPSITLGSFRSLGPVFGNDRFDDAKLLSVDATQDTCATWVGYHDVVSLFECFIRKNFRHANHILGYGWFRDTDWELAGRPQEESPMKRVVACAKRDFSRPTQTRLNSP
jgi:hypothetical protein